jgi:hypothetical protein
VLSPSDTAYPLLKSNPTERELQELFTPNLFELGFARQNPRQPIPRLGLLLLLKSFQKLGYFVRLAQIPLTIVRHIAKTLGWNQIPDGLSAYDASTARFRHIALVRSYVGATPFAEAARKVMLGPVWQAPESGRTWLTLSTSPSKSWSGSVTNYLVTPLYFGPLALR